MPNRGIIYIVKWDEFRNERVSEIKYWKGQAKGKNIPLLMKINNDAKAEKEAEQNPKKK